MREIKFRGKDGNHIWRYGDLEYSRNKHIAMIHEYNENGDYDRTIAVADTIGQFTGLQDSNGKDIYEGDIVKTDISRANATRNKTYRNFVIRYNAPRFWNGYDSLLMSSWRMEVIGNIHDNPELLNKGE